MLFCCQSSGLVSRHFGTDDFNCFLISTSCSFLNLSFYISFFFFFLSSCRVILLPFFPFVFLIFFLWLFCCLLFTSFNLSVPAVGRWLVTPSHCSGAVQLLRRMDFFQRWVIWRKEGGLHLTKSEPWDPTSQLPLPSWLGYFCIPQSTAIIRNVAKSFWPCLPLWFPPWAGIEWLVGSRHSKPVKHFTNVCSNYCASLPRQVSPPCFCLSLLPSTPSLSASFRWLLASPLCRSGLLIAAGTLVFKWNFKYLTKQNQ